MRTKKRILVTLIVAVLVGIVIFPMLPLEYREAIASFFAHPLYYLGLGDWEDEARARSGKGGSNREPHPPSLREHRRHNQRVSGIRSARGRLPPVPRR